MHPCMAFDEWGFIFCFFSLAIWDPLRPKYPRKNRNPNIWRKKRKQKTPFVKCSAGAHWTRLQNFRVSLKNGVDVGLSRNLGFYAWTSLYVYPKTITKHYGTLYYTSLRPVHKNTTIPSTNRSGGGSPSLLFVAVSPVPQGGVRLFIVLSYHDRLSFYRYRIIELSKHFRYDIIVSLSNDLIQSFDTISNAIVNTCWVILVWRNSMHVNTKAKARASAPSHGPTIRGSIRAVNWDRKQD